VYVDMPDNISDMAWCIITNLAVLHSWVAHY